MQNRYLFLVTAVLIGLLFFITGCEFFTQKDTERPNVEIIEPINGQEVSGSVQITANATDNVGVFKVTFLVDGKKIGDIYNPPYSISWNTATYSLGTHRISAIAYDAAGNFRESSAVQVTVVAAGNGNGDTPEEIRFSEDFGSYNYGEIGFEGQLLSEAWLANGFGNAVLSIADDPAGSGRGKTMQISDPGAITDYSLSSAAFAPVDQGSFSFDVYFTELSHLSFSMRKQVTDADDLYAFMIGFELADNNIVLTYTHDNKTHTMGTVLTLNTWHTISGAFNCAINRYSLFLDGTEVDTGLLFDDTNVDTINALSFLTMNTAGMSAEAYIDNIEVREDDSDPGTGDTDTDDPPEPPDPPGQPQNLIAGQETHIDRIELSWDPVEGAHFYYIYRSDSLEGQYEYIGWVDADTTQTFNSITSPQDHLAVPGENYFYKVQAAIYDFVKEEIIFGLPSAPAEGWISTQTTTIDFEPSDGWYRYFTNDDTKKNTFGGRVDPFGTQNLGESFTFTLKKESGSSEGGFGIVYRYYDIENYCYLFINTQGEYYLGQRRDNLFWEVQDWVSNSNINTGFGASNTIKVNYANEAGEYKYTFYFNDNLNDIYVFFDDRDYNMGYGCFWAISPDENFPTNPVDLYFKQTHPVTKP